LWSILLVDDEIELTQSLSQILINEGYQVEIASDGKNGLKLVLENHYDLLILDWMLPYKSGLEICQYLRNKSILTPVLFLTAKDTIDDRVLGLDIGADDYIVKPFELRELLARIRALLRRKVNETVNINPPPLKIADLELDMENQVAYRQGRIIKLSEKEIKLLALFMNNSDQLLTHEQIYQHLWTEEDHPSSNVVAAFVRLLRRKIEAKGETPLIHTVYGKGYRFGLIS
jgi:OmpR-family two-component system manganese-sensing response regulator